MNLRKVKNIHQYAVSGISILLCFLIFLNSASADKLDQDKLRVSSGSVIIENKGTADQVEKKNIETLEKISENEEKIIQNIENNKRGKELLEGATQDEDLEDFEEIEEDETIQELKESITVLKEDKKEVTLTFRDFIQKNGKLKGFFRKDLTQEELGNINAVVEFYLATTASLNAEIEIKAKNGENTEALLQDLLFAKSQMYKGFIPYVNLSDIEGYNQFILQDATLSKKGELIQTDIYQKEEKLDEKVGVIKEKISENKKILEEKMDSIMKERVREKFQKYANSKKVLQLSSKEKKVVFTAVLAKISEKRKQIEVERGLTNMISLERKIQVYKIMEEVLEGYILSLDQ